MTTATLKHFFECLHQSAPVEHCPKRSRLQALILAGALGLMGLVTMMPSTRDVGERGDALTVRKEIQTNSKRRSTQKLEATRGEQGDGGKTALALILLAAADSRR
jgi:hypothetical protein